MSHLNLECKFTKKQDFFKIQPTDAAAQTKEQLAEPAHMHRIAALLKINIPVWSIPDSRETQTFLFVSYRRTEYARTLPLHIISLHGQREYRTYYLSFLFRTALFGHFLN